MSKQKLFIQTWKDIDGYTHEKTCIVELPNEAHPDEFWEHLPIGFIHAAGGDVITYDISEIDHIKPNIQPTLTSEQEENKILNNNQSVFHCSHCFQYGGNTMKYKLTMQFKNSLHIWENAFPCFESMYSYLETMKPCLQFYNVESI
jgi:hypothetical protein